MCVVLFMLVTCTFEVWMVIFFGLQQFCVFGESWLCSAKMGCVLRKSVVFFFAEVGCVLNCLC